MKIISGAIIWLVILLLAGCSTASKESDSAAQLYEEAKSLADVGSYNEAISLYERLQSKYPYGPYTEQAWLEKAYLWYLQDLYQTSELELKEFIRHYPKHANLDYAYFMLGVLKEAPALTWVNAYLQSPSEKDVSFLAETGEHYRRFLRLFPNSQYAAVAQSRLPVINHELAEHEWRVAQYYEGAYAWVAVVRRCQQLIERYPKTIAARKALPMMKRAYQALGLNEASQSLDSIIEANPVPDPH